MNFHHKIRKKVLLKFNRLLLIKFHLNDTASLAAVSFEVLYSYWASEHRAKTNRFGSGDAHSSSSEKARKLCVLAPIDTLGPNQVARLHCSATARAFFHRLHLQLFLPNHIGSFILLDLHPHEEIGAVVISNGRYDDQKDR
jgi:hypothetical protein